MGNKVKVLLADDHLVVRMGIATILSLEKDIAVVGEASDGDEAVRLTRELNPDVVLMDIMMPKKNGVEATVEILNENPAAKVLALTSFGTSQDIQQLLDAGAAGAIIKTSTQDEIVSAIRTVASGGRVVSKEIENSLKQRTYTRPKLSARQLEVLSLVAKGFSNYDVARIIGIGVNGVKGHLKNIYGILEVSSRAEAAALAVNLGLITV